MISLRSRHSFVKFFFCSFTCNQQKYLNIGDGAICNKIGEARRVVTHVFFHFFRKRN